MNQLIDDVLDITGVVKKEKSGRKRIHVFVPKAAEEQIHREVIDETQVQKFMVGNYKIIKKVGKGRFSSVMLARHLFTGQQVAVKMVEKKYLDENELNTLMREVGILKQLNHPNIVRLFEVIITSETIYLVQEYCPHGEFYDYLVPKGKMKEEEAKKCFYQIFSAINYCHSEMVVHRDLKPENVLLDADLNIKLADFGLSRFYDPNEKCKTFCGSPFYAAPEIFTGTPYTGPEPDIWALGVMVYTVVSGILPFENASAATEGRYTMDDDISIHCQSLIRGCLQPDRYRRCTIKDCVMSEWIRDVSGGAEGIPGTNKEALLNLDQEILQLMESSGYKASDVLDSVSTDRFDDPYATYMLYRERKLKYPQLHNAVLADLMSSLQIKSGTPSPLPKAFASGDISQQAIQNVTTLDGRKLSMENFASELGMDIGTSLDNSHWGLAVTTTKGNKSADHSPEPPANTSYRTSMSSVGTPKSTTTIPESPTGLSSSSGFKHKQPRAKRNHKRTARVSRLSLISRTISYRPAKEIYDIVQNALSSMKIIHSGDSEHSEHFILTCVFQDLQWEIEVCRMPMVNIHGLKFKRLMGDTETYKMIVERVILLVEREL